MLRAFSLSTLVLHWCYSVTLGLSQSGSTGCSGGGFSSFPNCIIVNAQPFDRKSLVSQQDCSSRCLSFTTGTYVCRSFVYDNQNQVCDLFSITGNQSPAKLVSLVGRDYYEATGSGCGGGGSGAYPAQPAPVPSTYVGPPSVPAYQPATQAPYQPPPPTQPAYVAPATQPPYQPATAAPSYGAPAPYNPPAYPTPSGYGGGGGGGAQPTAQPTTSTCPSGQTAKLLRIKGYELVGSNDVTLQITEDQCGTACTSGVAPDGTPVTCKSFDYDTSTKTCFIATQNAAIPTGSGQLSPNTNRNYYEKACVDSALANSCPGVFDRFPQMLLVGYARTVVDASSFSDCLNACLKAQSTLQFTCTSGMYFFNSQTMNCILNSENRLTQPSLFVTENTDVVDYFDLSCNSGSAGRFRATSARRSDDTISSPLDRKIIAEDRQPSDGDWTDWTPCDRVRNGRKFRFQVCPEPNLKDCPLESQLCEQSDAVVKVAKTQKQRKPIRQSLQGNQTGRANSCESGDCCPYLGSCRIGKVALADGSYQWCASPCRNR